MNLWQTLQNWAVPQGAAVASRILFAVVIAVIGILAIRVLMKIVDTALRKSKLEKAAHSLIKTLIRTVLYILLVLPLAVK